MASLESDLFNHEYDYRPNWIGRLEVLLPINHNLNKICDKKIKTQEIPRFFFFLAVKKSTH